jgi:hypothetical protein
MIDKHTQNLVNARPINIIGFRLSRKENLSAGGQRPQSLQSGQHELKVQNGLSAKRESESDEEFEN